MNKIKTIFIISIAILGGVLLFNSNAVAGPVDSLVVQFETGTLPLFNEVNFLPGDTVTRWAKVTNNTTETQQIGTQAINVDNDDDLGDVMYLVISEGGVIRYSGTLTEFFNAGEKHLSDLGAGNITTYDYSITFDSGAGDKYQGLGLGFDFYIGFLGESISQEISSGGGGGGGGGTSTAGLFIFDEAVTVAADTATITWKTNLNSTSRVIYSTLNPAPVFSTSNPPNYGYAYSTIEDVNKVLSHSVTINGLLPATVYVFRCISHASPDTVGSEYSFTTLQPGETPSGEVITFQQGEVAGATIIRTDLPETGGILGKIAKSAGLSSARSNESRINLLIAVGLIFIWIVLFFIRKSIHSVK